MIYIYQTGSMKLLTTSVTRQLWYLVCADVENTEAYVTFFDTRKLLIQIAFPHYETIPNRAILWEEI